MELYRCIGCGRELPHFGSGSPPSQCEDCIPETGPGSLLARQFATNLQRLRQAAGLTGEELAQRAGLGHRQEVFDYEPSGVRGEPSANRTLRLAHSLGVTIDELSEGIYWNPGEIAMQRSDRRPPSERLAGFFLVPPAAEPGFEPPIPESVSGRQEVARIVGGRVRDARERRHLTQSSLARAAGLGKSGLSLIERGLRETTVETLLSLAAALEVPAEFLIDGITWEPAGPLPPPPCGGGARSHADGDLSAPIKALWREGKSAKEIADEIGTSSGCVSTTVHRLRERGEHLPYRRSPTRSVQERARRRRDAHGHRGEHHSTPPPAELPPPVEASSKDVAIQIGANIRSLRTAAGFNFRQLGEATEDDRTRVYQLENGKVTPRLAAILKLAASFHVRPKQLTSGLFWEPNRGVFLLDGTEGRENLPATERLGANALRARQGIGASQGAVAARATMSRGDVVDFERGNRTFRLFTLIRLSGALDTDVKTLLDGLTSWHARPLPPPEYAPGEHPPTKTERDAELIQLWRQGRPEREIADALGLSVGAVGALVRDLRNAGKDLPYRRPPRTGAECGARRRRTAAPF